MTDYTGRMFDQGGAVFNVKAYGAAGNGNTDDTDEIRAAVAALNLAGGGILFFPPGSYKVFSDVSYSSVGPSDALAVFSGLSGVRIEGYGATLITTRTQKQTLEVFNVFVFDGCANVSMAGLNGVGHAASGTADILQGGNFVVLRGACRNVDVEATLSGFNAGLMAIPAAWGTSPQPADLTDDTKRSRGIRFALDVTNCGYGVNFQFSGDDVQGTVVSNGAYRSYFPYGVRDHDVRVDSRNHVGSDVLLKAYSGLGLDNVALWYTDTATTTTPANSGGTCAVEIDFGDTTPATIRNVRIHYDVKLTGSGITYGPCLRVVRHSGTTLDTGAARGHRLQALILSGRIAGAVDAFDFDYQGSFAPEELSALGLADLVLATTNQPAFALGALRDQVTFRNVVSNAALTPVVSQVVRVVKEAVQENTVQQISPVSGAGAYYRQAVAMLSGSLGSSRDAFQVKLSGDAAFFRLRAYVVSNATDFNPATRGEAVMVRTWSASIDSAGGWGGLMPVAAEGTDRVFNLSAASIELYLHTDNGKSKVGVDFPGFTSSSARVVLLLEVFALAPVEVLVV